MCGHSVSDVTKHLYATVTFELVLVLVHRTLSKVQLLGDRDFMAAIA